MYILFLTIWWLLLAGAMALLIRRHRLPTQQETVLVSHPSAGLSPAAMRYLYLAGFDSDCLIASVLNAAVNNTYQIVWKPDGFTARKRPGLIANALSQEEIATFTGKEDTLLEVIHVGKGREKFTLEAEERLENHLKKNYRKILIPKNLWFALFSVISGSGITLATRYFDPAGSSPQHSTMMFMCATLLMPAIVWGSFHLMQSFQADENNEWMVSAIFIFSGILILYVEWVAIHSILLYLLPFAILQIWIIRKIPRYYRRAHSRIQEILHFRDFLSKRIQIGQPLSESEYFIIPYLIALNIDFPRSEYFKILLNR